MSHGLHHLSVMALAAALAGCGGTTLLNAPPDTPTLGITAADSFAAAPTGATAPTDADLRWWNRFSDPALAQWVERALANSPDTAIARERVVQAQALLRGASARRGPLVGAEAAVDARSRRAAGERRLDPSAALTLDWDLDLWGSLRQAEQSAAASLLQAEDLAQAARLSTAGLTARAYVAWQEALLDEQLLDDGLSLQREVLRLVAVRVNAGLTPQLDLDRAQTEAATLEADAAEARVRVRQGAAALQVLAGERPQPMAPTVARLPVLRGPPTVARPIDLLRQRPDLRAAERGLAVAAADLGVAQADLYPRLRLPGAITLTSAGLGGGVLDIVSATLAAVLDVALFDGGERSANVDAARSRVAEAGEVYRLTLLEALQQAEAALVATEGTATRTRTLQRGNTAARSAVEQARTLYTNGLTGFLDVIEAQRSALDTRRNLLRAQADAARQAIAGFEAMGLIAPVDPV